jgi:hypothetical protein
MTNQLRSLTLILMILVAAPGAAAGQSTSLRETARALGGKASTSSDVDLPPTALPELVKKADFIVQGWHSKCVAALRRDRHTPAATLKTQ